MYFPLPFRYFCGRNRYFPRRNSDAELLFTSQKPAATSFEKKNPKRERGPKSRFSWNRSQSRNIGPRLRFGFFSLRKDTAEKTPL